MQQQTNHLKPGTKIWQQPPLEEIIENLRDLSPNLQGADARLLFRLVREYKRSDFGPTIRQLKAEGDRNKIYGFLNIVYDSHPRLRDYLSAFAMSAYDAGGVPTFEFYQSSMESTEQRMRFGVPEEDLPTYKYKPRNI